MHRGRYLNQKKSSSTGGTTLALLIYLDPLSIRNLFVHNLKLDIRDYQAVLPRRGLVRLRTSIFLQCLDLGLSLMDCLQE